MKLMTLFLLSTLIPFTARGAGHGDHPAVHGMALFGSDKVYLSHLPLFHAPHDYQIIMEAELDEASLKKLQASKAADQEPLYTIAPEAFVLPEMAQAGKSFSAELFRGHFERGGVPVASGVNLKITRVILFKQFDPRAAKPATAHFILFGNEKEQFAAHLITAKPDFDQILKVLSPSGFTAQNLVFSITGKTNSPVTAPGRVKVKSKNQPSLESVTFGPALYTETGDLEF